MSVISKCNLLKCALQIPGNCKSKFWSYIFSKGFKMSDFRFLVTNGKLWSKKLNCYKERKFTFAKKIFWVHRWGVAGATRGRYFTFRQCQSVYATILFKKQYFFICTWIPGSIFSEQEKRSDLKRFVQIFVKII